MAHSVDSNDIWFVVDPKVVGCLVTITLALCALCYFGICGVSADVLWVPSFLWSDALSGRALLEDLLRVLWIVCGTASTLVLGLLWANHNSSNDWVKDVDLNS